ncbi:MAG: hypothetical protein ACJAWC_002757 [Yoonia sp.]|jgi:hypothetical protein
MVTNANMEGMLSERFSVPVTRLQANGRHLLKAGLRESGGKGRGSTHMTGRDVGAHMLVLAMKVQTKDIVDIIAPVMQMSLRHGHWVMKDQGQVWGIDAPSTGGAFTQALRSAGTGSKEFPTAATFGDFLGQWIDGVFEPALGTYLNGEAMVVISDIGPRADFTFHDGENEVALSFSDTDEPAPERPILEAKYILRDGVFQQLYDIIKDREARPNED